MIQNVVRVYVVTVLDVDPTELDHPTQADAVREAVERGREYGAAEIVDWGVADPAKDPLNPRKPVGDARRTARREGFLEARKLASNLVRGWREGVVGDPMGDVQREDIATAIDEMRLP